MGVVYRAFDTRLNRPVAIKFLANTFADANARRRFQREAQTASSLNHPHIVTVYDIGVHQDQEYLVTEYVDNGTLRSWVKERRGWRAVVELIAGVADALATAHGANILHRDIKPENVLLMNSGYAKLTDFGIAKVIETDTSNMTTVETETRRGTMIGTIAYMSPEQALSKSLDQRSDVFSFGVMLHELISGVQPFTGATNLETLQRVIHAEPLPIREEIPPALRSIVDKALEKNPRDRYQSMRDLVVDLRRVARGSGETVVTKSVAPSSTKSRAKWLVPAIVAAVILALLALWAFRFPRNIASNAEAVRLQIPAPPNAVFSVSGGFAVSPDGKKMVFSALGDDNVARLWLRNLGSNAATPIAGTEHDPRSGMMVWSPDSSKILFATTALMPGGTDAPEGGFFITDLAGGTRKRIPVPLQGLPRGGAWGKDFILLGNGPGILRFDVASGKVTPLTAVSDAEVGHHFPVLLPDGNHFLYLREGRDRSKTAVFAGSIDDKPEEHNPAPVLLSEFVPEISETAAGTQLLLYRGGTIYAQDFDTAKLRLTGNPTPVVDQVDSGSDGQARFSISNTGVLAYRVGGTDIDRQFTLLDRKGNVLRTVGEPKYYWTFKVTPDTSRAVVALRERESINVNIVVVGLQHGGMTSLTSDGADGQPVLSADGRRVAWQRESNQNGKRAFSIFQRLLDASDKENLLVSTENTKLAANVTQWTPDSKYIISFGTIGPGRQAISAMPTDGKPGLIVVNDGFVNNGGSVSPNGRWIAYRSNQSGRNEIWVQPFPTPDGKTTSKFMVSRDGAFGGARWRKDGRELLFIGTDGYVTAVPVTTEGKFASGTPEPLFKLPKDFLALSPVPGQFFDATPDNQTFVVLTPANRTPLDEFTVILNWPNAMKKPQH
jgi:Tol biopolymer transport system component